LIKFPSKTTLVDKLVCQWQQIWHSYV